MVTFWVKENKSMLLQQKTIKEGKEDSFVAKTIY